MNGLNPDNAEREYQSINCKRIIDGNFNILYDYTTNKGGEIFYEASVSPFITNDLQDIQNWSFDYLLINGGTLKTSNEYGNNYFWLETIYNGNTSRIDIDSYYTTLNNTIYWTIPRNVLLTNNAIINGNNVQFNILEQRATEGGRDYITYNLDIVTFDMSQQEQDNINEDKTQQALDNISNSQQQTTNSINNLNDNITNDNISNSVVQVPDMPTDTSGVENGVNNIFTTIMNAYTNFNANQDIVFPIPFTNKNITINGNYTKNMLESVNATWIINIITAFWWYVISVYIVKDILKMVDKIQEGKIDNIENSNIKGDML